MAIRVRRGLESELDITKALPGEFLVSTDSKIVRICIAPGIVKEIASVEEVKDAIQKGLINIQDAEEQALKNISDGLDKTLSVEGKAADAKATGEKISKLSVKISQWSKISYNEFDIDNVQKLNGNITDANPPLYRPSNKSKCFILPCEPNTSYCITRKNATSRLGVGFTADLITAEETENLPLISANISQNANKKKATSPSTANYMVVFYYNSNYDTDENVCLEEMMVAKGTEYREYIPHKILSVERKNLSESIVADIEKGVEAYNGMSKDRWGTRRNVYGIQFDITDETLSCTRIADAVGLKNDYVVNGNFVNDGINDFDNIFPWCEMRLCNVRMVDGKKHITYQGEPNFALDGSNGNVMVEIPCFYFKRERIGNIETWAITGEKKSGFEAEPWFVNTDGSIEEFRYYGAYEYVNGDNAMSFSGERPTTGILHQTSRGIIENKGFRCNNFCAVLSLRHLIAVEFATLNIQSVIKGLGWFFYSGHVILNTGETTNTVKVAVYNDKHGRGTDLYRVGNQMCVGTVTGNLESVKAYRTITAIETDAEGNMLYTLDGEPIEIVEGDRLFGTVQKTGGSDTMTYHTGVSGDNNGINAIKYRGIENPWENAWENLDGIKFKEGKYYYTFNSEQYADDYTTWKTPTFDAPIQNGGTSTNDMWTVRMGYDVNDRLFMMPDVVGSSNGGSATTFFGDGYYSTTTDKLHYFAHGGGWDHSNYGGLFTMRSLPESEKNWLYGERITC